MGKRNVSLVTQSRIKFKPLPFNSLSSRGLQPAALVWLFSPLAAALCSFDPKLHGTKTMFVFTTSMWRARYSHKLWQNCSKKQMLLISHSLVAIQLLATPTSKSIRQLNLIIFESGCWGGSSEQFCYRNKTSRKYKGKSHWEVRVEACFCFKK